MPVDKKIILIVEDGSAPSPLESKFLEKHGFNIITASSGEEAVEIVRRGDRIDLVLMDIILGSGMDGVDAAEIMLKERNVPVVFMSSQAASDLIKKIENVPSYGLAVKNSGNDALLGSIKIAMRLFESRRVPETQSENLVNMQDAPVEGKKQFKHMIDNSPLGAHIYELSEEGKLVLINANNSADRILGIEHKLYYGKTIDEAFPGLSDTDLPATYKKIAAKGGYCKDRRVDYYEGPISGIFLINAFQMAQNRVAVVFSDITERIRFEEALIKSERLYNSLVESSHDLISRTDEKGNFVFLNSAYERIFGYKIEELLGKPCTIFLDPSVAERDIKEWVRLLNENGEVRGYETLYLKKDGTSVPLLVNALAMRDDSGKIIGVQVTAQDITEWKHSQRLLEEEKERLSVTLRSIGDGVISTDINGRIMLMNKVAEKLTGWTQAEALGKDISDIYKILDRKTRMPCDNPVHVVLKGGSYLCPVTHALLVTKSGGEVVVSDSGFAIRDRESGIMGAVLVLRDFTEYEIVERNIQNSQKLESIGVLAGGIAHDFNNLLGGLFGYMELAREAAEDKNRDKAENYLSKAMAVFNRAKNLTQQLLIFSKGGKPVRKLQSVENVIREALEFVLSGSNLSASVAISHDLWFANIDENQIAQVIDNIIINARQAMPLGGKIEIIAENIDANNAPKFMAGVDLVKLSIRDYGTGISKEHISRIFDPFFTTKQEGSGLGLATSYSIIKNHDGFIDVESELGKGTVFYIYLPAEKIKADVHASGEQDKFKGQGKILVMDDEPFILDVTTKMLEMMGFSVVCVANGDEAIDTVRQEADKGKKFFAALLDLTIPGGLGGKEAVKIIKEIDPSLKVIASSGYSNDLVMSDPAEHGFETSLVKPYRYSDVVRVMNTLALDDK